MGMKKEGLGNGGHSPKRERTIALKLGTHSLRGEHVASRTEDAPPSEVEWGLFIVGVSIIRDIEIWVSWWMGLLLLMRTKGRLTNLKKQINK